MKFASLVLSGLLLVVLAGCGSDGDSGRVNQLTADLEQAAIDLEAAEAARMAAEGERDAAQTTLQTTQGQLTTTRTDLQEAEGERDAAQDERDTAQQQRDAAQAEADAQRRAAEQQRLEEERAEAITRAYGLLEAMDVDFRGAMSTDATNVNRSDAAAKLGTSHPLQAPDPVRSPRISNNAPNIRQTAGSSVHINVFQDQSGEFSAMGGIPSLSLGGRGLSSTRLENTRPLNNTEEMAIYTDFRARNPMLLDLYTDYRRVVDSEKTNEIQIGTAGAPDVGTDGTLTTAGTVDVSEKMRENLRTLNEPMYGGILPEVLALQPRLSGVTLDRSAYRLQDDDYTVRYVLDTRLEDHDSDPNTPEVSRTYTQAIIKSFPAAFRGVSGRVQIARDLATEIEGNCGGSTPHADCATQLTAFHTANTFTITTRPRATTPVAYEPASYTVAAGGDDQWVFAPGSTSARVWVDDGNYLYFGWWQVTPDEADGVYDFHVIANGVGRWRDGYIDREEMTEQGYSLRARNNVVYTGPAVGKYVRTISAHEELDHAGEFRRDVVDGIFTANTRLEANFTAGVGTGGGGTVMGSITNFVDEGSGQAVPGNWQVVLGGELNPDNDNPSEVSPATISFSGATSDVPDAAVAVIKQLGQGGGDGALPSETQTGQQSWEVFFMADELSGPNTESGVPSLPAGAVGRFDVGLEAVIHFSGAFGVSKN